MRKLIVAALALAAGMVFNAAPAWAMVGGGAAAQGQYAFVASVDTGEKTCSGVLVDPLWVLTVKSCFATVARVPSPPPTPTTVTVGRTDLMQNTTGTRVAVAELSEHPTLDVVLAKLATPVAGVTPATIGGPPVAGEVLRAAGYGRTATEWVPDLLHVATVRATALTASGFTLTAEDGSVSMCQGDAGGPTIRDTGGQPVVVGIHQGAGQGGCLDSSATDRTSAETRADVLDPWIRQHTAVPALNDPSFTNLARAGTARATSEPGNTPGFLVPAPGVNDGVRGQLGWSSNTSATDHDEYVEISLNSQVPVNRVDVFPRTDIPAAQNNFPSHLKVSVHWPIPPRRTGASESASIVRPPPDPWVVMGELTGIAHSPDVQSFAFPAYTTPIIRVYGIGVRQMQLAEVEIYYMYPYDTVNADSPLPSIVEGRDYPAAAAVFAERGVHLYKGDGHITLVDCGANPNSPPPDIILVQTFNLSLPGPPDFCFKARGTSGYLTMEIGNAYLLRGEDSRTIAATVQTADEQTVIEVEQVTPGEWQPVGVGQSRGDATILELRF
jgi:hypothetical protein